MSHLRDIQKLRNNRNPQAYYGTAVRFSPASQPETYYVNIDRFAESDPSKTCTIKFN
jgi:hypothetical protein